MDELKDIAYWVLTIFGIGSAWGHNIRKTQNVEDQLRSHVEECKAAEFMTIKYHDKVQADCQNLWRAELRALSTLFTEAMVVNNRRLDEMHEDIKEIRRNGKKT